MMTMTSLLVKKHHTMTSVLYMFKLVNVITEFRYAF